MIIIDNVLVSDEVVEENFLCVLSVCNGGCCEEGDAGAPLEEDELDMVLKLYKQVEPYLSDNAKREIERKGKYQYHKEFGWVTPTLSSDNEICVYGIRDKNKVIKCIFEMLFTEGKTKWQKPKSCHLFPLIKEKMSGTNQYALNFQPRKKLCAHAKVVGKINKISLINFLQQPIIRNFGEKFFQALQFVVEENNVQKK